MTENLISLINLQKHFGYYYCQLRENLPIYSPKPFIISSNIRSLGVSKTPNVWHQVHIITHLSSISGDRASDSSDPRHLDNRRPGEI